MLVTDQPENLPSTNQLDNFKVDGAHPLQLPAIDATFVSFLGDSGELIDNPPQQDEERTYIVKAVCDGYDIRKRKDGERRVVAKMQITSCFERGRVPIVDENQGSLFGDSGDGDPEGGDGE